MNTLDRYIAREFVKSFLLILVSFVCLYLIIDFFEKIRMFLSNHATLGQMASFFFFGIPMIIAQTTPVAVLLSSLITFGVMARHSEVLAMKGNGISLHRASVPIVVIAAFICILTFLFSEFITPAANQKADYIKLVEVQKRKAVGTFKQDEIWYRGRYGIYNFRIFEPETNTLTGVVINHFDRKMNLIERIDAERAEWREDKWVCHNVLITRFPAEDFPVMERLPEWIMDIPEKPSDFMVVQKDADTMGYLELRRFARKIEAEGYDATRYLADMHAKIAYPFIGLIVAVLGISFSLRSERSGGVIRSIGAGVAIGFSYWIIHAFALSLGRSGVIPPLLAAWLANIILGATSIAMFSRIRT